MAVNPDPKPGRWMLPLVILGMIAFTYFFVRELPGASPGSTTTVPSTTTTLPDGATTTLPGDGTVHPDVQAYLDAVDTINTELQALLAELVAANTGFDANPRTVTYPEAQTRFEKVDTDTTALETRFNALTAPTAVQNNHSVLALEIGYAALAAGDALEGLTSDDPGTLRRQAVDNYVTAAGNFDTEVATLHTAAGTP